MVASPQMDSQPAASSYDRPVIFKYPALPRWEGCLYIVLMFAILFYAWYCVYEVSMETDTGYSRAFKNVDSKIFGKQKKKDVGEFEWMHWTKLHWKFVPVLIGHTVLYNTLDHLGAQREPLKDMIMLVYSVAASVYAFGVWSVAVTIAQGIIVLIAAHVFRLD